MIALRAYSHLSCPAFVFTLREFFNGFRGECLQVAWPTACHQSLIGDYFFVDPIRPGIFQIGFKATPRGHGAPLYNTGLNKHPRRMADCRYGLVLIEKVAYKAHCPFIETQMIGILNAAR